MRLARTGLLSTVKRDRRSGLGRPIQFRSVGAGRRGHAGSGSVSGACVGPCPSVDRPPSLHALRHRPVGRCCSRLHRYYSAVRLLLSSGPASLVRASRSDPGPPGRLRATGDLPGSSAFLSGVMWSQTPAERQHLAQRCRTCCLRRFQPPRPLQHQAFRSSIHTPQDCCVRFATAVTVGPATLATGRPATALPGPDFHRLECASFAWRTDNRLLDPIRIAPASTHGVVDRLEYGLVLGAASWP